MLMLLAALQSEYGIPDPQQLEGLMAGLAAGDRESLAQLYHRTRAAVYGLALSILGSGHDAEDVTQDTYVTAWEKCHLYRPQGTPMAWLLTITRNLARMKLRDRGRTQDLGEEQWHAIPAQSPSVTPEDRAVLEAALSHAGVSASQASEMKAEQDWDDGVLEYEVEFKAGGVEYEYTIHGGTGQILKYESDQD